MTSEKKKWEKFHPETVWPTVEGAAEYNWKLRYAPNEISEKDYLSIASILTAYCYLRENPGADWKQKVEALETKLEDATQHHSLCHLCGSVQHKEGFWVTCSKCGNRYMTK